MNKLLKLLGIITIFCSSAATFANDEAKMREQAKTEHNVEFPSYVTWKYCEGLRHDFMTVDMQSLQSYSGKNFNTRYKGPIKNIVQLLEQRKNWLSECDQYLSYTKNERIFNDTKTTKTIFAKMDLIRKELQDVIDGARYSSENGDETQKIVAEKFEALFVAVDNHNNLMHLRGKYVYQ